MARSNEMLAAIELSDLCCPSSECDRLFYFSCLTEKVEGKERRKSENYATSRKPLRLVRCEHEMII